MCNSSILKMHRRIINRIGWLFALSGEKQKTREGFLGTSALLQLKISKHRWQYMDGELFYIRYTLCT